MIIRKIWNFITGSSQSSQTTKDKNNNSQSDKNHIKDDSTKTDCTNIKEATDEFKKQFETGTFSVEGSKYETQDEVVATFQDLLRDIGDKEAAMRIARKWNLETSDSGSGGYDINDFEGTFGYDRDEPMRRKM